MRPALREGYQTVVKVLKAHEYKADVKIKHFPNGNIRSVKFDGLNTGMVEIAEKAIYQVMVRRDKGNLDQNKDMLGLNSFHCTNHLSNKCFVEID